MYKTIIHTARLSEKMQDHIHASLPGEFESLGSCILLHHSADIKSDERLRLSQCCAVDINRLPPDFNPAEVKLMISDMDSTMITIECIDEIADFAKLKKKVSLITDAAMRGEIDFKTSLHRRVALLKDVPDSVLERVYTQRLKLSSGAEQLLLGLQQQDIRTALVSGGFTFFTERLQQRLKFDYQLANQLEVKDNRLTGEVIGEVVTASRKASFLEEICTQLSINVGQAIAIGDGANDIEMLNTAGLGVAYRAKTIVQQQSDVALNFSGLNALLDFFHAA